MADLIEVISGHTLPVAIGTLTFYILYGVLYHLSLSPISFSSGPRLAGMTYWYEFYYEIFPKHGQFIFHIRDLHAKYGPIVRINPYELHISTPEFYETIYSSSKKRDKWSSPTPKPESRIERSDSGCRCTNTAHNIGESPVSDGSHKRRPPTQLRVSSRLPSVPHEPLVFSTAGRDWVIPAGTPVSMSIPLIHQDKSIFPNRREFRPERRIEDPRLDKFLASFSKGSRNCVGMHLAYAEQYLWLSGVFRRFGSKEVHFEKDEGVLELFETDASDVDRAADAFFHL